MDLSLREKLSSFHPWKGRKYYKPYMKDTWETPSANTMQDNVYIGLESMKTSGKWLKNVQHANTIAHRNQDSHSNQPQYQNTHGNTGADFFTFDGFEYLVIVNYYTKMPFIRKIPPS